MKLASVSLLGQQITQLESPFLVKDGIARLESVSGRFLGGDLSGDDDCWIDLDAVPRYHAACRSMVPNSKIMPARFRVGSPIAAISTHGLNSTARVPTSGISMVAARHISTRATWVSSPHTPNRQGH